MDPNQQNRFRPSFDSLESRETPAVLLPRPIQPQGLVRGAQPQKLTVDSINQAMVNFLASKIGVRLGGGECAHLATEALRVGGAQFSGFTNTAQGDYVWGTFIKKISLKGGKWNDSNPSARVQPGDVIQYHKTSFTNGIKVRDKHTSVVAAVNAQGMPTKVYEQNIGLSGKKGQARYVSLRKLDLKQLDGGWVQIYHPIARQNVVGQFQYTIVNNTTGPVTVDVLAGSSVVFSHNLDVDNTIGSFQTGTVRPGSGKPMLRVGGKTITIENGAAYAVVSGPTGLTIQKLSP